MGLWATTLALETLPGKIRGTWIMLDPHIQLEHAIDVPQRELLVVGQQDVTILVSEDDLVSLCSQGADCQQWLVNFNNLECYV